MSFSTLATSSVKEKTKAALLAKGYQVSLIASKTEALALIKMIIPAGASVTKGSSTTLEQIGLIDYMKSGKHGWDNLAEHVLAEKDPVRQARLRKETTVADYYLGSVHALTEAGEFLVASNTASQLPSVAYNASHLLFVVGTHKIVPDLESAMQRLRERVVPMEDERSKAAYGSGTSLNKILWFLGESSYSGRTIHFILVDEVLGF